MYGRSRSPDRYRDRPYSPSRPLSPGPPRAHPSRDYRGPREAFRSDSDHYDAPPRRRSPSPPRRHEPEYPGRRYDDYPVRPYEGRRSPGYGGRYDARRPSPPGRYDEGRYGRPRSRSPPPPPRTRDWDREGRDGSGMMADKIPPPRPRSTAGGNQWERGRDAEELETGYGHERQEQSGRERRARKEPSAPSKDIIFIGLDPELTEHDFMGFLVMEHSAQVESVKISYDRVTGKSRCFGFANFVLQEDAEEFINNNYPSVLMPALHAHSDPRKVKIDFAAPPSDAPAESDFGGHIQHVKPGSDGMRDIGTPGGGNRVLLLRSLNFRSTGDEIARRLGQEIARMLQKGGREKEAEGAICRIAVVVDKETKSRWGFAFVELATTELATALLSFLVSPQTQPNGFVISDFHVAATFSQLSSFVPIPAGPLGSEYLVRAARDGGMGSATIDNPDSQWVGYWHEQAGFEETVPKAAPQIGDDGNFELPIDVRGFLGHLSGPMPGQQAIAEHSAPAKPAGPVSISMTGMQPIKLGGVAKGKRLEEEGFVASPVKNLLEGDDQDIVGKDSVLLSRTKGVSNIIPPSKGKVQNNISKWNTKKSELKAPGPAAPPRRPAGLSEANSALGVRQQPASGSRPAAPVTPISSEAGFDYTDTSTLATTGKVACLLCQRQFKDEATLKRHVDESNLHKQTNLENPKTCEEGMKRKNAAIPTGSAPASAPAGQASGWGVGSGAVYRDRAAERRITHHQPDNPSPAEIAPTGFKRKYDLPKPARESTPPPAVEPGKDVGNIGNQLLGKMGWKAGTGLGVGGEGRVDPVMVQQFEARAGLGRSQGRDPASWDGAEGFKRRAMDMTRERFERGDK